jgi:2-polyprenyl-3-methyl-5-hydroxy-6-metoxy-1,4-benzoquinol methylase
MKKVDRVDFNRFSQSYKSELNHAVKFSGESSEYFTDYKAGYVAGITGPDFSGKILDFGCGVGLLSRLLKRRLPAAHVHGYDVSPESIQMIPSELRQQGSFSDKLTDLGRDYNIAVIANVLHHVPKEQREQIIAEVADRLLDGGRLIVFEHNPLNPLTRLAVHRCAFDGDAVLLCPNEACGYFSRAKLRLHKLAYIVFFPSVLSKLRRFEPILSWLPAGAQYVIVGEKCAP